MTLRYYTNKKKQENTEEYQALLKEKKHYSLLKNVYIGLGTLFLVGSLGLITASMGLAINSSLKQSDILAQTRYEEFNLQVKKQKLEELDIKYDNNEIGLDEYYAQSKAIMKEDYNVQDYLANYEPEYFKAYNDSESKAFPICLSLVIPTAIMCGISEVKSKQYEERIKSLDL